MTRPERIVLQCNRCKKLYSVKQTKWEKLLQRWGTVNNAIQNYVCKKCEYQIGLPDYKEKPSSEEVDLLSQTIDGKPFNPLAVAAFVRKIGIVRRMWNYAKVLVVDEKTLKDHYKKWLAEQEKRRTETEQGGQNGLQQRNVTEGDTDDSNNRAL
jgi:transposase-like protein